MLPLSRCLSATELMFTWQEMHLKNSSGRRTARTAANRACSSLFAAEVLARCTKGAGRCISHPQAGAGRGATIV